MRIRKIFSAIIAMAITATAMPIAANAAQPTDATAMEKALTVVKQRVDIPAELTEFTSNAYDYGGAAEYSFYWSDEDNEVDACGM